MRGFVLMRFADYTHVIYIGSNELGAAVRAITRYSIGGAGYQDPVAFDKVFEVDAETGFPVVDDDGLPVPTFQPMIEVRDPKLLHPIYDRRSAPVLSQNHVCTVSTARIFD